MDVFKPVYTEQNDCQDCYKCIRECKLKAIKVVNNSAQILHDDCIYCGTCTLICPVNAKKVRNDVNKVKGLLKRSQKVIVSLAPSFVTEFPNLSDGQIVAALKTLGFTHVSETALGAQEVSKKVSEFIENQDKGIYISSACPSVVEMICKHYPKYKNYITPFLSPLLTHSKYLKNRYGGDTHVVFIGPCIAKKAESDQFPELLDAALTFSDLRKWFEEENIDPYLFSEEEKEAVFVPGKAGKGVLYPIDGGMIMGVKNNTTATDAVYMTFSGITNIQSVLVDLDKYKKSNVMFLELLACDGGCVNGPGTSKSYSTAIKRLEVINKLGKEQAYQLETDFSIERTFDSILPIERKEHAESSIKEALTMVGKYSDKDEINCGGCGYNSCREFAGALLEDRCEPNMCVSYMRKIAHDKSSALLRKIPSGVVIVNEQLKIIEANLSFSRMMGAEIEQLYEAVPGLVDADLHKIAPFYKLFSSALSTGVDNLERDIRFENKMFHITLFSIHKNKIVGAILRDMSQPFIQREEVISRAKSVNQKNLETVQKIAYLLGENASETEEMLNSIVEFYSLSQD
ncbi:[Fe-Fe] hydrogenase large subunit C-terminal domain-containing protein [Labilibaculum sp. K2S]|uniref:[Fe-Fe] hydrogenase large subunit C-terminal domain-containing protein n=1 Tax=Labilibaculum sp. K2S TaxID=3056386 RepID=UPI0025A447DF|nr:[Fe-Fe] hydrogenase large subunit C-terminal domain-containing protein [Labilibaculum sp. K2S]MDM8158360.1 [Fe-Fe] hydrogenase large subunit C-terminal domain-containing protein [Labilibaculum sp. K2S]